MNSIYRIGKIYDRNDKIVVELRHKVGRFGHLTFNGVGKGFIMHYINYGMIGETLKTTAVINVEETDYGVWITTEDLVYRLDSAYIRAAVDD